MPPVTHFFTVDLEDWRHGLQLDRQRQSTMEDRVPLGMEPMLEILAEHGVTATVFVLGRVAARHPALVRRIAEAGHEIASHGWSHDPIYDMAGRASPRRPAAPPAPSPTSRGCAPPPTARRSSPSRAPPCGRWRCWRSRATRFPVHNPRYGISGSPPDPYVVQTPAGPICEIPISTRPNLGTRIPVTGGAYLRI